MSSQSYDIIYQIQSFPIIFTLDPTALDAGVLAAYPRLVAGEVQYSPEYKNLSISSVADVKLNPTLIEYGVAGNYREVFMIPEIASPTGTDNSKKTHMIRQRNFEDQVLRAPSERSRLRRIFTNVGIQMVTPKTTTLDLEPFMAVYNGVSEKPLIIRDMVSRSFQTTVFKVSGIILTYLFGDAA